MQLVPVDIPDWLLSGIFLGLIVSTVVAGVFILGAYFFPDRTTGGAVRSGEVRRRTEIRQYLHAIDEPFAEDHLIDEQPVEFYLPNRDVAITFDARAFYAIEHSSTHAVLVEHEMPGIYLGNRLPFETPSFDLSDEESSVDESDAALAVLGLPSNATDQQIRAAYRKKVKAVHPDMGGDPEAFQQVNEAYATISDDTK